jgi:uncharacterized membrane protein
MSKTNTILVTVVTVGILIVTAIWAYYIARADLGTIVLPGGSTYLGPSR